MSLGGDRADQDRGGMRRDSCTHRAAKGTRISERLDWATLLRVPLSVSGTVYAMLTPYTSLTIFDYWVGRHF